ncbi:MAG: hypothetical protein R2726_03070 [Acidimicrobiales bacterium]
MGVDHAHGVGAVALGLGVAERLGQLGVLGLAAAPQHARAGGVGEAGGQLLAEVTRLVGRHAEDLAGLLGREAVAVDEVGEVADPLAEHVGGVPHDAGDLGLGRDGVQVDGAAEAVLGGRAVGRAP